MHPTIDPECTYCPRCGDEYRAEIRTCAACGVDLVRGALLLARLNRQGSAEPPLAIEPDEPLVAVRRGPLAQIKALHVYLVDCGLPSLVTKEEGGACGCRGPEVVLQVREADLDGVMEALAREYLHSTGLAEHDTRFAGAVYDAGATEAVCPACGCRFTTTSTVCPDCGLCFA